MLNLIATVVEDQTNMHKITLSDLQRPSKQGYFAKCFFIISLVCVASLMTGCSFSSFDQSFKVDNSDLEIHRNGDRLVWLNCDRKLLFIISVDDLIAIGSRNSQVENMTIITNKYSNAVTFIMDASTISKDAGFMNVITSRTRQDAYGTAVWLLIELPHLLKDPSIQKESEKSDLPFKIAAYLQSSKKLSFQGYVVGTGSIRGEISYGN